MKPLCVVKGVARGGGAGWAKAPPQILSSCSVYKELRQKGRPKFRKMRQEKQLSGYKHISSVTYIQISKLRSVQTHEFGMQQTQS